MMIEFFRDVLDGPLYIAIVIISIIFIMAIIGFLMERKKLEKEAKSKIAVVENNDVVTPIEPVSIQSEKVIPSITSTEQAKISSSPTSISDLVKEETNASTEVKPPIIVFEDSEKKNE